jgi:DHA2 family multidrug resistance protein
MSDAGWKPRANPWLIAIVVTLAAFIEVLDTTIVNVSLPHIAGSLSCSYDDATWVLTSYLVANGIVLPISGWLSDVFGRKRYFMLCITMFTLCSLLCGTSQSLPELVIFRLLQGFFGGGLQPCQQAIMLDTFPLSKRAQAMSVVSVAAIAAPVLGPTLGGLITDNISWRWAFFINVPVGIAGVLAVAALVEDPPWVQARRSKGIDYIGIGLIALGLGAMQLTLDRGQEADWFSSPLIRMTALLALVGCTGAVLWLLTTKKPVVNLFVLADRSFSLSSGMLLVMTILLMSSSVMFPQFAQSVLGYTATQAGMVLSPAALAMVVMIPLVARLMGIMPTRAIIGLGFGIMGAAMWHASYLVPDVTYLHLVLMRFYQITGLAMLFVPISTFAFSTMPRSHSTDATALYAMFRNIAGSIGISLSTTMVAQHSNTRQAYLAAPLNNSNPVFRAMLARYESALRSAGHLAAEAHNMAMGQIYRELQRQAEIAAFADAFRAATILAFAVVPFVLLYPRGRLHRGGSGGH